MNHLREVLSIEDGAILIDEGLNPKGLSSVLSAFRREAESAVCFWVGSADEMYPLAIIPELCRLPFEKCWFEVLVATPGEPPYVAAAFVTRGENHTESGAFTSVVFQRLGGGRWAYTGGIYGTVYDYSFFLCHPDSEVECVAMLGTVFRFLSALHCSNVTRENHAPSEKLQRSRARRGKRPLFSYWTLNVLHGGGIGGGSRGGTHASPRVHLRRGHPRQYAPGKWTWVQPHAVGNPAAGVVHKDYALSPLRPRHP